MAEIEGAVPLGDAASLQKLQGAAIAHAIDISTANGAIEQRKAIALTATPDSGANPDTGRRLRVDALISGGSGTTVSKNKAFTVTHATVVVGAGASVAVMAANANRVYASVQQLTAGGILHVMKAATATTAGKVLNGRGAAEEIGPDNFWDGAVSVFNPNAGPISVNIEEGTNP